MPSRTITVDGARWNAYPSGFVTQYDRDEFGVMFVRADGPAGARLTRPGEAPLENRGSPEVRVVRYSPHGSRFREAAFVELSEERLVELFRQSQPGDTSPEAGYVR
jgi:hypothetical protein